MRHHSRQPFPSQVQIKVSNPRNGALIGYVGDISESGVKIFSDLPFVRDERMRMKIHGDGISQFALDAICKWSDNNDGPGYFAGGFYLEQPPAGFIHTVEKLRSQCDSGEKNRVERVDSRPVSLSA